MGAVVGPSEEVAAGHAQGGPAGSPAGSSEEFSVVGFAAPFVVVRRKSDGVKGTLGFTHSPRVYFNFEPA
jgi:hypothetical protein